MKLGIMQPYFFPYIGYWQLMNAVDKYVVYDDVTFIKGGWINRNRILINGKPSFFNLPILGSSSNKLIREINVSHDAVKKRKLYHTIELAYKKAPYFNNVMPIIEDILSCKVAPVSLFLLNSFNIINKYLGIETELISSSDIPKDNSLKGQSKVLEICRSLQSTEYYNAVGGMNLYNRADFLAEGIELRFLKSKDIVYKQFNNEFRANLSIIDVMMFCSIDEIQQMLNDFEII